jgi:hypothetical protein
LIARAYNPALGQEENARRVKALMTQIQTAHQSQKQMAQYFRDNGTLQGYEMNQEALADSLYNMFPENSATPTEPEGSNNDQLNAVLNKYEG